MLSRLPGDGSVILVGHFAGCLVKSGGPHSARGRWCAARHERTGEVRVLSTEYRHTGSAGTLRGLDAIRSFRIAALRWCQRLPDVSGGRLADVEGAGTCPLTHP